MELFLKGLGVVTAVLTPILAVVAIRIHKKNSVTNRFKLLLDLKASYLDEANSIRDSIVTRKAELDRRKYSSFNEPITRDGIPFNSYFNEKSLERDIKRVSNIEKKLVEIESEIEAYHKKIVKKK